MSDNTSNNRLAKEQREPGNLQPKAETDKSDWLAEVTGMLKDNPDFDEIVRLGKEIRDAEQASQDEDSWLEWYRMTPLERWYESSKLWEFYLQIGGSLDPEPDSQSPFDAVMPHGTPPAYGRPGLRVLRRSGV